MDNSVYSIERISNGELTAKIRQRANFVIEGIPRLNMPETVATVEKLIEAEGLTCRVYQKGRIAAAAVGASLVLPVAGTIAASAAAAAASAVHHLVTRNPDYEVAKNFATGTLTVTYQK